jgi:hypothetical protein
VPPDAAASVPVAGPPLALHAASSPPAATIAMAAERRANLVLIMMLP